MDEGSDIDDDDLVALLLLRKKRKRLFRKRDKVNLQRQVYSGHKRVHCLNYPAMTAPGGICLHFWGAMEGRRHDTSILRQSGLLEFLEENRDYFYGTYIYGDPAYGEFDWLVSDFKGNITLVE